MLITASKRTDSNTPLVRLNPLRAFELEPAKIQCTGVANGNNKVALNKIRSDLGKRNIR